MSAKETFQNYSSAQFDELTKLISKFQQKETLGRVLFVSVENYRKTLIEELELIDKYFVPLYDVPEVEK